MLITGKFADLPIDTKVNPETILKLVRQLYICAPEDVIDSDDDAWLGSDSDYTSDSEQPQYKGAPATKRRRC